MFIPFAGYLGSCAASMAGYFACQACTCVSREVLTQSARVAWSALFFVAMVTAWILRDFAKPLLEKIPWIIKDATGELDEKWFGQQAVYRVSMGSFLFFATMSATMIGIKYKRDSRDKYLHHGNWLLKLGIWLAFTALPFLLPNNIVDAYAWAARFGSGIFLVIQMVILLDFVQSWNDSWVASAEEDEQWYYALLGVTVAAYAGSLTVAGLMFHWFKPSGLDCSFNVLLITLALLLCVVFSVLSLIPSVTANRGSIFPASVISLYCMYLCFSALQSEPKDYQCNGLAQQLTAASGTTLASGMIITLISVIYAAFRAGSNTRLFTLDGSLDGGDSAPERAALLAEAEEGTSAGLDGIAPEAQAINRHIELRSTMEDEFAPITYNYSFFHLIFALASMYIAMLMTGWGSQAQDLDHIDVGWASVLVKTGAQWVTSLLYCWTLMAPALFPDRDFS
ncbi:hypothetical protein CEUSTIGMA_g4603.t1 [Chlamydomonas eustigma]|uniref:Serine incorporator n=1 Tax=Chlamydomonas eustigma TaxID=1157962 RepID=A0A250X263_9CHLO|nr:hypothetical protein CEUSTIGMA_g4603.t1 [Chlamydomonas eustigma]|eukprot:GAX77158.1 hypothetical protein CEUSTIGMA_g4603.t1 [Chlamydomonas eustigma]